MYNDYRGVSMAFFKNDDDSELDFIGTKDIREMYDKIGFISPSGIFYFVRNYGVAEGSHGFWATQFLAMNKLPHKLFNYITNTAILIKDYGFVMLVESPDSKGIEYTHYGNMSNEQQEIINGLLEYYALKEDRQNKR